MARLNNDGDEILRNYRVSPTLYRQVQTICELTDTTVSQVIRDAFRNLVKRHRQLLLDHEAEARQQAGQRPE